MRNDLVSKYDMRIPRYTSYPTAPHFSPAIGADDYKAWLSRLSPETELSLYLHIAYCAEMCWFCGCHTKITRRYGPIIDYMNALHQEIAMVASCLPARMRVRHVHFGGGSPTVLTAKDFTAVVDSLRRTFILSSDAEIAVEIDPRTVDESYCEAIAACGVNRASIGVQDFDPVVQTAVNRIQSFDLVQKVVDWLKQRKIEDINLDLMYGLPYQNTEGVLRTIDQAVALGPRRLSLFGYAHVPWMKKHQTLIPEDALPSAEQRWEQYERVSSRLVERHGFVAIGLDHFAVPDDSLSRALQEGCLHRNFQGYTVDPSAVLIAFGASGIGFLPQGYVANAVDIHAYKNAIRSGKPATTRGIAINDEDRLRRDIIERLMCDMRVDLAAIAARHGQNPQRFHPELASLASMQADGLLTIDGFTISLTDAGRPLMRAACATFDQYLKSGEQRHSKTI